MEEVMSKTRHPSRRKALTAGITSLAATSLAPNPLLAGWKAHGETRVIYHGGDFYHNQCTQETMWGRFLTPAGWRLMFAQDVAFITPDVLEQTDLLILCRYATDTQTDNVALGWTPERFVENRTSPSYFMTDELEDAIVDNVANRGMGLLSIHCSIWNGKKRKYMDLLGVEKPHMHTKVQPSRIHKLNADHPITAGVEPCNCGDDEIFFADLKPGESDVLFNLKGEEEVTDRAGGWCREVGNGRVVALLPGHTPGPYMQKSYKEIMWRSAHWALKKDIKPSLHITENGYQPRNKNKAAGSYGR